jgi:hypothetical protein
MLLFVCRRVAVLRKRIAMHAARSFTFAGLGLLALAALSGQASAGNVAVGLCAAAGTHYLTIQAAVTAVETQTAPNVVRICPGTYHEQITIDAPLTLEGIQAATPAPLQDAVVILPPSGGAVQNTSDVCIYPNTGYCSNGFPIAAQILVENTTGVTISNLTVDGTGNGLSSGCSVNLDGILFQNASGTVGHVAVRNQLLNDVLTGCQTGDGIYVESSSGSSSVSVTASSVHNYNKNGITGRYAGTTLTATGNYVQGQGIQAGLAAANGIELAFGAAGTINTNTVIDNVYQDPTSATAADILLFDTEEDVSIEVNSNTLGNSQVPIGLYTDTAGTYGDGVFVESNRIFGTGAYDAIDVCTNGNIVKSNTIFNSAESGVHLDASCGGGTGETATNNIIVESACAGILVDSGAGGTTTPNTDWTVPFPVATSTSACTIPEFGGAASVRAKGTHKHPTP